MSEYDDGADEGFDPAFANDDDDHEKLLLNSQSLAGLNTSPSPSTSFAHDHQEVDPFFASTSSATLSSPFPSSFAASFEPNVDALGRDTTTHDDDGNEPPLRRSRGATAAAGGSYGNAISAANRMSLAFELASASTPGHANRDLMRELEIEEEDDDRGSDSGSEEGVVRSSEDDDESGSMRRRVGTTAPTTPRASRTGSDAGGGERPSPGRRSMRSGATASSDSLHADFNRVMSMSSSNGGNGHFASDEVREEEANAAFLEASTALESSLETTHRFLDHLRQHTVGAASTTLPVEEDRDGEVDFTDRQPKLEALATLVVRSMYEVARRREEQFRELTDLERLVLKNDHVSEKTTTSPTTEDDDAHFSERLSYSITSTGGRTSARVELSALRDVTSSLIVALSALNEVSQVNQALVGDAGRKLRALRGHLVTAKEDLRSVERSEAFIRDYERTTANRRKGVTQSWLGRP